VVAIRLGCINHAQLTVRAIEQAGLNCAGWIATCLDFSVLRSEETMQTLKLKLNASNLGILPYRPNADFNFFARQLRL
jgi:dethiobiotin synthetase